MGPESILLIVLGALAFGLGAIAVASVLRRMGRVEAEHRRQAAAFEQQTLVQLRQPEEPAEKTEAAEIAAQAVGHLVNQALGKASGPAQTPSEAPAEEIPGFIDPEKPAPDSVSPSAWQPGPLAKQVIGRLDAAGLVGGVDGPLRTSNPAIQGTIVRLTRGGQLAIQETPLLPDDPSQAMVLRLFEGVVVAGPGGEPIVARRLQALISELFD